ncbi:LOW QUALITY PROTEIN: putative disease resistance protein At3g14460 [Elaeis guineensis]|uniref:LOW QUALITY PROTEIN: putative disease resistance protein At3g14460 n=1 Tax=Elaeis guineensis var. tenera TaxID=51953 RepID=UPI003C6CEBEB
MLLNDEGSSSMPRIVVIPIIGMGGFGKTEMIAKKLVSIFSRNRNLVLDHNYYDESALHYSFQNLKNFVRNERTLQEHKRQKLQLIASKISKILRGLPLAGIALGNLLSSNLDSDHWKIISKSAWWEHDSALEAVLPSLAFNYQNLDASQKLCFAYCSIFPRGYIFDEKQLVNMVKNLRTILFYGTYEGEEFYKVLKSILKRSKSLRTLDLSHRGTDITNLPNVVGRLSHLRYLDISNTKIRWLPKSFSNLCHLQVLEVRQCHLNKLPNNMNKLISLRHLSAESKMVSLISGIGKLTGLQELQEFKVKKKKGPRIDELKELNELQGKLLILNIENVSSKQEAMNAGLKEKKNLDGLHLYFKTKDEPKTESSRYSKSKTACNLEELLEALEPCCDIKDLGIKDWDIHGFPNWLDPIENFIHLQSIHLSCCHQLTSLPPLGHLHSLKLLHIEAMPAIKTIGAELYGSIDDVFPSLEELKLQDLQEFEAWMEVRRPRLFPRLRKLYIWDCLKLKNFALLKLNLPVTELNISSCGDLGASLSGCFERFSSLTIVKIALYPYNKSFSESHVAGLKILELSFCSEVRYEGDVEFLNVLDRFKAEECPKFFIPEHETLNLNIFVPKVFG